jgi:Tfp pilus assembly major pilin PilA
MKTFMFGIPYIPAVQNVRVQKQVYNRLTEDSDGRNGAEGRLAYVDQITR